MGTNRGFALFLAGLLSVSQLPVTGFAEEPGPTEEIVAAADALVKALNHYPSASFKGIWCP